MKRKNCPLPPHLAEPFEAACRSFTLAALPALRRRVELALARLREAGEEHELGPNIQLAQSVAARLLQLIEGRERFDHGGQRLIVGAVSYFLLLEDAIHDHTPLTGLDDDVMVLNHVLEELGMESECLEL